MRLIDTSELYDNIRDEFEEVCVYDVDGSEAINDFEDIVNRTSTIEAIPINWIENWIANKSDDGVEVFYQSGAKKLLLDWKNKDIASIPKENNRLWEFNEDDLNEITPRYSKGNGALIWRYVLKIMEYSTISSLVQTSVAG